MSINKIARELTRLGVPKGHRATKSGWHPQQIHRMLTNEKYIGLWHWGATTTIRNSAGQKKQIQAEPKDVVRCERPELRLIEQDIWDRVQARLRQLAEQFGFKPGQAKRGPKAPINPANHYPRSLLGRVLRCGSCGEPMWYKGSGGRRYYSCSGYTNSRCQASFHVPAEVAEQAVLEALTRLVAAWPDWLRHVHTQLCELLVQAAERLPREREQDEQRRADLQKQLDRLIDAVAQGLSSVNVQARIAQLEAEIAELNTRLVQSHLPTPKELELPSEHWVREQLKDWVHSLADPQKMRLLLHQALEKIEACPLIPIGKKRGTVVELTLYYQSWGLFKGAIGGYLPLPFQALLPKQSEGSISATETLRLGKPTPMDQWTLQIVQWRLEGVAWTEIVRRTGLDLNRVYLAWKRYQEGTQQQ